MKTKNNKLILKFFAGMTLLFFSVISFATPASDELVSLLANTRTIHANFTQKIFDENGGIVDQSKGVLIIAKPDQFHWQITAPMTQLVISNGKRVWIYDPDLEQVVIKSVDKTISATPIAILSGSTVALAKSFNITKQKGSFQLDSKQSDLNFKTIYLQFDKGVISAMTLLDNLGQKTELHFANVQLNAPVKANDFKFTPPKGVDVVEQ